MTGFDQQTARSGLEKSLVELARLRASQLNGRACCIDVHTAAHPVSVLPMNQSAVA